jgi:hypothetical protein
LKGVRSLWASAGELGRRPIVGTQRYRGESVNLSTKLAVAATGPLRPGGKLVAGQSPFGHPGAFGRDPYLTRKAIRRHNWHHRRVDLGDLQLNLRLILNQWDPIGVAEIACDQYDYLLGPLLTKRYAGAGRAEISEFLWYDLEEHFGLDPARYDIDRVTDRLVAWRTAAGST